MKQLIRDIAPSFLFSQLAKSMKRHDSRGRKNITSSTLFNFFQLKMEHNKCKQGTKEEGRTYNSYDLDEDCASYRSPMLWKKLDI